MSELRQIHLTVNGMPCEVEVEPRRLLVHCLRLDLGLTGTHIGCETAQCGACVVLLNGRAAKACNLLALQANGAELVTIEGLAVNGQLHAMQEAFCELHAVQCGFCTPGMIMTACKLLEDDSAPSDDDIRAALFGNLCRCTGYQNIVAAVRRACELLESPGKAQ